MGPGEGPPSHSLAGLPRGRLHSPAALQQLIADLINARTRSADHSSQSCAQSCPPNLLASHTRGTHHNTSSAPTAFRLSRQEFLPSGFSGQSSPANNQLRIRVKRARSNLATFAMLPHINRHSPAPTQSP